VTEILRLRKPEATGLDCENLKAFSENLKKLMSKHKFNVTKESGIVLFTLLPHALQPLECTIFGPCKKYYNACLNDWILSNPGKPVTVYSTADILENVSARQLPNRTVKRGVRELCSLIKMFLLKMRGHEKSWILTDKPEKSETEN
jgi:hypothetical protein